MKQVSHSRMVDSGIQPYGTRVEPSVANKADWFPSGSYDTFLVPIYATSKNDWFPSSDSMTPVDFLLNILR